MKKITGIVITVFCFLNFAFAQTIAGGDSHSLVVCSDSISRAFGDNTGGQLGTGNNFSSNVPVQVNGLTNVSRVAAGLAHSLAVKSNGTVRAWGWNGSGQLGNGSNTASNVPVAVSGLSNIISISGGWNHSLAVKNDGTAWAWGNNFDGQLGIGTSMDSSNVPVQVSVLTGAIAVAGGDFHSLALKNNGTVWVWGGNGDCQFGNGSTSSGSNVPLQVPAFSNVVAIATGRAHCLAIKNDSTLWAWGDNTHGQLGDSTNNVGCIPMQVSGLTSIVAIAAGYGHSLALKSDGTLWAWGENDRGQLGIGNNSDSYFPVQVSGLSNVSAIAAGLYHSVIRKTDGTVWAWGENYSGQLGIGNNNPSNIPVQITGLCQIPTTSEEKNFILALNIFPNLASGEIRIESLKIISIEIYNLLGSNIYSEQSKASNQKSVTVDVSKLNPGIYFVRVKTDKGMGVGKFVKE